MPYADLEVIIQRWPERGYAIDLRFRTANGEADTELAVNVPLALDFARLRELSNDPAGYGRALGDMAFADQIVRDGLLRVRAYADGAGLLLRLRLRLDPAAPELHAVRWEALYDVDSDRPFVSNERLLLSRYLDSGDLARIKLPALGEVSALIAVASPRGLARFGLAPFDGAAEAERVRAALAPIPAATLVSAAEPVTLAAIIDALRFGYSILYLVCHGTLRDGTPYLWLEDAAGEVERVAGDELVRRIADLRADRRPALVVLASCQSVGVAEGSDVPAALGPQLARAGVSAVLGMQGNVPQSLVAELMPRLFAQLHEDDGAIDSALAVARAGLSDEEPWWMPVLFLRLREGRIWRADGPGTRELRRLLATPPAPPPVAPPPAPSLAPAVAPRALWIGGAAGLLAVLLVAGLLAALMRPESAEPASPTSAVALAIATSSPAPPTSEPSPTAASPISTPMPTVAPVADGKYMVLVADLEPQTASQRDYARDIFEDLRDNLGEFAFSDVEIRRLRRVISSEEEARAAAAESRAAVVLWGRYDESRIDLEVQSGDLSLYPSIPPQLDAALIRRTTDMRLRLSTADSPLKSPAFGVLAVLNVLETAEGDGFGVTRVATIQERLQRSIAPADAAGQSAAVRVYQFVTNYYSDTPAALAGLNAGLTDDPDNLILLIYRGTSYQRLGNIDRALQDARTVLSRLPTWTSANYLIAVFEATRGNIPDARAAMSAVAEARPNDWFPLSYRAGLSYLAGDLATARADADAAIGLGPATSQPYTTAIIIALREGRVGDARALSSEVRRRFSAQRGYDNSFYQGTFGGENAISLATATFDQLVAGQLADAIALASRGIEIAATTSFPPTISSDLLFMRGMAQCVAADDAGAAESYGAALGLTPEFALLYLLRADARQRLGDIAGALEDVGAATTGPQAELLGPLLAAPAGGQLTCKSLLQ
jgi:tetratricopeptide (TPR) repeat protein